MAKAPQSKSEFILHPAALIIFFAAYFITWAYFYLHIYMNTDFAWLFICLERFIEGGTYVKDFYETNPPLSFLIYLPAYPLYKLANLHPAYGIFITFLSYIIISAILIYSYLRLFNYTRVMIAALLGAFLLAQTWLTGASFGQKDQLIMLFIIPYVLLQAALIAKKQIPKYLLFITAILGAIAICIKPYYIVIPLIFFLYRYYSTRSITDLVFSYDTIIFALTGIAYLVFLNLVFPDYINTVLPEAVEFYKSDQPFPVIIMLPFLVYSLMAFIISLFVYETEQTKHIKITIYGLIGLSLLCVLPYLAQNKGFIYQAMPFISFSVMAFLVALFGLIYQSSRKADLSIVLSYAVMITLIFSYMTGSGAGHLTPKEFEQLPYNQKIKNLAWNGVYMDLEMKPSNIAIGFYLDLKRGSRFGQIWPIFGLKDAFVKAKSEKERKVIRKKIHHYIDMIAQDMVRYKPSALSIPRYNEDGKDKPTKAYFNFLMKNQNFAKNMENYEFVESFEFDEHIFERGGKKMPGDNTMITYDLYKLRKDNNLE